MPRWLSFIRGVIGTGLTFSIGVGVVTSLACVPVWLLGRISGLELLQIAGKTSVIAFPVGVLFSGLLAITARGRSFERLSLRQFAALGGGVGFIVFMLLGVNGAFWRWSLSDAMANFTILTLLGSGSATASLMLARKARPSLKSGDESLGPGS